MEGYKTRSGKPDVGWWLAQIKSGEEDRREFARDDLWDRWRDYYRNKYDVYELPKNLFFTMRRTIVPRIYFRNPSVSIVSKKPGAENIAVAKVLERIDNQLILAMGVKKEMKQAVDTAFITGTAVLKLGFGAEFTPTPNPEGTEQPVTAKGERVEHNMNIFDNMPWIKAVDPANFVVAKGAKDMDDTFFTAEKHTRPWDDVVNDDRFPSINKQTNPPEGAKDESFRDDEQPRMVIDLWEIRDRRNRKVFVIAPSLGSTDEDRVLIFEDDEFQFDGQLPYYEFSLNPDDQSFWGVSDANILGPYQEEINQIKQKMSEHRRLSIAKIMYEAGSIDDVELQKMLEEQVGAGVKVNDINGVQELKLSDMPRGLVDAEQMLMQDVREIMGFSRNALGEFSQGSADRTATETQVVKQASEIRIDERKDKLADVLVGLVNGIHQIIFNHWTTDQVVDVIGPDRVQVWVQFTGEDFKGGKFNVAIDPDSSVPETKAVREQKAIQIFQLLSQSADVSQIELLKILVGRLGTEYESLIPEQPGGVGDPVSMENFKNAQLGQQGSQPKQPQQQSFQQALG